MNLKSKTTKELVSLAKELHDSLYVSECFGSRDVLLYSLVLRTLEERGYSVAEHRALEVVKNGV